MISARINVERGWGDAMARRLERQIPGLIQQATEDGAEVARAAAQSRRRTGRMAEMEVFPVQATPRGYVGGFRSKAWYAKFQNKGTSRGITALGFLEKGRTAMRKSFTERLNRLT